MIQGGGVGEGRQSITGHLGSVLRLRRLGAEVLTEVVAHVLGGGGQAHHGGRMWSIVTSVMTLCPVSGPPVFTHLFSAGKQFATLCAGNFLLVHAVLTNGLKREREIIIGSHKNVFMAVL